MRCDGTHGADGKAAVCEDDELDSVLLSSLGRLSALASVLQRVQVTDAHSTAHRGVLCWCG